MDMYVTLVKINVCGSEPADCYSRTRELMFAVQPGGPGLTRLMGFWTGLWTAVWTWFWIRHLGAGRGAESFKTTRN